MRTGNKALSVSRLTHHVSLKPNNDFVSETGSRACPNGYNFFLGWNIRRADLDLPQFDLPPAEPVFSPVITHKSDALRLARPFGKLAYHLARPRLGPGLS